MKRLAGLALVGLLGLLGLLALAGCPRGRADEPAAEPVAEPAPVEIDWPDAGPR